MKTPIYLPYFIVLMLIASCRSKPDSLILTNHYNHQLCNDYSNQYPKTSFAMKYLLDTIMNKHPLIDVKDTNFCFFEFHMFGETGCYFIDKHDTIYYSFEDFSSPSIHKGKNQKLLNGQIAINNEKTNILYNIKTYKKNYRALNKICEYKLFFKTDTNCPPQNCLDCNSSFVVLKYWLNKKREICFTFYKKIGNKFVLFTPISVHSIRKHSYDMNGNRMKNVYIRKKDLKKEKIVLIH